MRRLLTVLLSFIAFGATAQTTQLLGGPGIKVLNRGDFQADSILYLPRTLVTSRTPTQAGALRYQASDSALYQWTGTAWRKAGGGDVDTLLLSTRAWRQKGIDSVASVRIGGSGVTGYIPKFTATRTLDSSQIFQQGGNIGIATAIPDTFRLNVNGAARTGTLTVNTNGQAIRISTNQATANGSNIFIGTGGTALNGTGFQSSQHVAIGINAGDAITTANNSVSIGVAANQKLTTGNGSIAIGTSSLQNVTSGSNNVAMGVNALSNTTTSGSNVAIGVNALQNNITGSNSTAIGSNALQVSTTNNNVGIGSSALGSMTSGSNATAVGTNALLFITTASNNTAIGYDAGRLTNAGNALQTAANSTFIGNDTRASADGNTNEIVIGHSGRGLGSNSVVLGNSSITNTYLRGKTLVNTTTDAGYQFQVAGEGLFTSSYSNTSDGQIIANSSIPVINLRTTGNTGRFSITTNYNAANTTSFLGGTSNNNPTTEFMRFAHATGFMGIGGSTPNYLVTMNGTSTAALQQFILAGQGNTAADGALIGAERVGNDSVTLIVKNQENYPIMFYTNNTRQMTLSNAGELWVGYTTDQGAFSLQVNGNALINGNIRTAAPAGGTANDWRLGTVATVTPTSPNRTIEVSIGGTIYYIHAKTTND